MANREIVVVDASLSDSDSTGKTLTLTFACWLVAPANRVRASPNFVSRVPPVASVSWGVSSGENTLLALGTLVEQVATCSFDLTLSTPTFAQMEASLQAKYASLQTLLNNQAFSVAHIIGASWDGTTWTAGP